MTAKKKPVVKKITARMRHREVAARFQSWLDKHPDADKQRRISTFDAFCDSAVFQDELKRLGEKHAIGRER